MEHKYGFRGETIMYSFSSYHVWKPGRISLKLPEPLWSHVGEILKEMKVTRGSVGPFLNGENYCDELVHVHNLGVWDPSET